MNRIHKHRGWLLVVSALLAGPAMAATITFDATLSGANEVPSNSSTATGSALVSLTVVSLTVNESFSGLIGPATAAHIHCCAPLGTNAQVAIPFALFPAATSGTFGNTFDLTNPLTYTSTFITNNGGSVTSAEAALIFGLDAGDAYVNIHDAAFPGGEIRGQLAPVSAPEPAVLPLLILGLGAIGVVRRRRIQ